MKIFDGAGDITDSYQGLRHSQRRLSIFGVVCNDLTECLYGQVILFLAVKDGANGLDCIHISPVKPQYFPVLPCGKIKFVHLAIDVSQDKVNHQVVFHMASYFRHGPVGYAVISPSQAVKENFLIDGKRLSFHAGTGKIPCYLEAHGKIIEFQLHDFQQHILYL